MERALLDTCVLYPSLQRDFLLQVAELGGYRPAWSTEVLRELRRHEERKLLAHDMPPGQAGRRADKLIQNMRSAFPDAEVTGYEHLQGRYRLPDPNDEHVVAAADHAKIRTIVTENRKHFPPNRLPQGTEIVSARELARRVVESNPRDGVRAVEQIAARSGRLGRDMSVDDVIRHLERANEMTEVAAVLRRARGSHQASVAPAGRTVEQGRTRRRAERGRRGGPGTQRLQGDLTEQRGGHQDRGRGGREGPRTR